MRQISLLGAAALGILALAAPWRAPRREAALGTRSACEAYQGRPEGWLESPTAGMVWIEGGRFVPGSTQGYPEEKPGTAHEIRGFWIDRTEVTRAQFEDFVKATGYVTVAEREGRAAVFGTPTAAELESRPQPWWRPVSGATWRNPEGPGKPAVPAEPVVQVAYEDALAYARWLNRDLPTEAEWEFAARAGRDDASLHRAPRDANGTPTANFWQGDFPLSNTREDGFERRAPVGCYAANAFGLHDTLGNVWEWTRDVFVSPHPPSPEVLARPATPDAPRVIKGGSFLCSPNFCARYRVSARQGLHPATSTDHLGFRTVLRSPT